jgi:DNA-binding MarR family transcriptional regulator
MEREQTIQVIFENFEAFRRAAFMRKAELLQGRQLPTHAQIGVMFMLRHLGPLNIKDLAAQFRMTSSAATQLVDGLVKDCLVKRTEDSKDRRKTSLELTAKGSQVLIKARKFRLQNMNNVFQVLSNEELAQLEKLQRKLVDHLQDLWIKNQPKR